MIRKSSRSRRSGHGGVHRPSASDLRLESARSHHEKTDQVTGDWEAFARHLVQPDLRWSSSTSRCFSIDTPLLFDHLRVSFAKRWTWNWRKNVENKNCSVTFRPLWPNATQCLWRSVTPFSLSSAEHRLSVSSSEPGYKKCLPVCTTTVSWRKPRRSSPNSPRSVSGSRWLWRRRQLNNGTKKRLRRRKKPWPRQRKRNAFEIVNYSGEISTVDRWSESFPSLDWNPFARRSTRTRRKSNSARWNEAQTTNRTKRMVRRNSDDTNSMNPISIWISPMRSPAIFERWKSVIDLFSQLLEPGI